MTRALTVLLLIAASGYVSSATDGATGYVYEDLDRDGRRDDGEPGIPGVSVSNGREVVRTDADGSYRLTVTDETILFVTKPAGYRVPVDANNLPQFYYRHYPSGTPQELHLRYRGVDPTGPLPESVDFPLHRETSGDDFEAIWFADPQPQTEAEVGYVRDDVVAELVGTDAVFGITVGDIMFDDLALFNRYNQVIGEIGIPWYNVPGNHELNYLSPDDRHSLETFKRHYGPTYYSFDYGKVHFVVLDDVHYLGKEVGRDPNPRKMGGYEGRIGEGQLSWLENDLRYVPDDQTVVLAMHIPLVSHGDPSWSGRQVSDRDKLLGLVEDREHVMAVAGHTHTTEHHYLGPDEGFHGAEPFHLHVITTVSGSWWSGPMDERGIPTTYQRDGTPNGYHVMTVRGNRLKLRYKAAGAPADYQMRISLDTAFHQYNKNGLRDFRPDELTGDIIEIDRVFSIEVVANLFDGGPRSKLEMRVDDRAFEPMQRVPRIDPFVQELFLRNPDTTKSWVEAEPSSHVWTARLPEDLGVGAHTIEVRATDEYGQSHTGRRVFEVVGRD